MLDKKGNNLEAIQWWDRKANEITRIVKKKILTNWKFWMRQFSLLQLRMD